MPKDTNIDNLYRNIEYKPHQISNQIANIEYQI